MPKKDFTTTGKGGGKGGGKNNDGGSDGGGGGDTGSTTETFRGGRGGDTYVYDGSRYDYDITTDGNGNWTVIDLNPDDGDTGTDYFTKWESFEFNDFTVSLRNIYPAYLTGPDSLRLTLGESVEFTLTATDGDGVDQYGEIRPWSPGGPIRLGSMTFVEDRFWNGPDGGTIEATYVFDSGDIIFYHEDEAAALAEGEIFYDTRSFIYGQVHEITFEIVGVNDLPVLTEQWWDIFAFHNGANAVLDLAPAGSDVDSDDTGASLTYEVVSVTEGFQVRIEGTTLILEGGPDQAILDSDESVEGAVEIRARDRHGAYAEDTIIVDLSVTGSGQPISPVMQPDGTVDLAALGVVAGEGLFFDIADGYDDDPALLALLSGTDGDDLWQVTAARMGNIMPNPEYYDFYEDNNGPLTNYESLPVSLGDGNDLAVLRLESDSLASMEMVSVATDGGDDIVHVTFDANVSFSTGSINTGMGSDQVYLRMGSSFENLWAGSINTGSGHDYVDVHLWDSDTTNGPDGFAVFNGGVSLGSGNDHLRIVIEGTEALSSAGVGLAIDGGAGDDFIFFDNSAVTLREDAIGYKGGYDGEINLGTGNDHLVMNLSLADGWTNELEIDGGFTRDDVDYDVVELLHLTAADDFTVTRVNDWTVELQHMKQIISFTNVDEVTLGDGTSLFGYL
ncbi:hypothetical protein [Pseudooceanicola onchidii]|uniref:hypothetical protein n=1 Tax=Pseudooceanicola onchidii TaxID=2562279 RepID=UPI00145A121B|nr:hypothetical protein [Pseudooceanicola onchidii]